MRTICHIITGLQTGGVQHALFRLTTGDAAGRHVVISLMEESDVGPKLRQAGIDVHALGMPAGRVTWQGLKTLRALLRDYQPDIVQTWLYHADLIGGVMARLFTRAGIVWGIRFSSLDHLAASRLTHLVIRICAWTSRFIPHRVISCSHEGATSHQAFGYTGKNLSVIPNGYDLEVLQPDATARTRMRAQWQAGPDECLFGMAARWDPQKDHKTLLDALARLQEQSIEQPWRCVLFGREINADNPALMAMIQDRGLSDRLILLDEQADIAGTMNGLDVHVLSSNCGEGFPNVVAESMACGVPGIATDVGDAAIIMDGSGWLVEPEQPAYMAQAMASAIEARQDAAAWQDLQDRVRALIVSRFSLDKMVENFGEVWRQIEPGNRRQ